MNADRKSRFLARRAATAACLAACLAAPATATAQTDGAAAAQQSERDAATRRLLLEQAEQARAGNDHARAVDLAQRAGQIRMTPSVRMFIAQEYVALNRSAEAFGAAELCVGEAERDATLNNRAVIVSTCRGLMTQLRPQVGTVTVHVPAEHPAGFQVLIASQVISEALYGLPNVVDPGRVVVEARHAGDTVFRREVEVQHGGAVEVDVVLPAEAPAVQSRPSGGSGGSAVGIVGPVVFAGLGVVSLGLSAAFLVLKNDSLSGCRVDGDVAYCRTQGDIDRARQSPMWATLGNVFMGVGIAAVVGGVTWFIVARATARSEAPPRAWLDVTPVAGGASLGLSGRF